MATFLEAEYAVLTLPSGNVPLIVGAIPGGGVGVLLLMVTVSALLVVFESASVTVTVNANVPAFVGLPLRV